MFSKAVIGIVLVTVLTIGAGACANPEQCHPDAVFGDLGVKKIAHWAFCQGVPDTRSTDNG